MIKQTTTLPIVDTPEPEMEPQSPWARWAFIALEVVLLGAIPVLAVLGFRSLLDSRAGEFAVAPGPEDPGWMALVDPSPIGSLVDVDEGQVAGAVLIIPAGDTEGGTVILVSGATEIDGIRLSERTPDDAIAALETELRIVIDPPLVMDEAGWRSVLGDQQIELANPDPVLGASGRVAVEAGRVLVGADVLAPLSSRPPASSTDPEALEFRRSVLWRTLLTDADFGTAVDSDLSEAPAERARALLAAVAAGVHRVETLPLDGVEIDSVGAEELVRSSVARPLGPEAGARLQVRIIDRSGTNDLAEAARNLGRAGFEVVQIGNAAFFDDGPTQLLVASGADEQEIARLAEVADAATVPPSLDPEAVSTVTLLLGARAPIALPPG